ncbi:DUF4097 family beta strand repeat-containing protein [uncultured Psychroserpens sp.]|uniref:DUF4097 family beta strand repeat-containing protein n=1 Tax=uncultured Psychroserpens sp. TaxID=255436 RepID=UPI002636B135|nr:DUF4097 family beta strand repeat-containing protein [uncultured Psychroserpens sp.]
MKHIITTIALLLIVSVGNSQEKEKRIKFNKGTLKICSNSHMTIKGYDGDEVIIKSLNESRFSYYYDLGDKDDRLLDSLEESTEGSLAKSYYLLSSKYKDSELEKGLKPLGNKSARPEDNLYLDITEKPGELIIKDYQYNQSGQNRLTGYINQSSRDNNKKSDTNNFSSLASFAALNNKYEILIPNSIKLSWNVEDCSKKNSNTFFIRTNSTPWELNNFKGEVEISTSYNSISLTNVSGPVIANTIGGNITVVFDKITPTKLYSLVSNDGYIDMSLPDNANLNVDVNGERVLSNINFTVLDESIEEGIKKMKLQLNSGKTKMKLDAGSGSVYLRKLK